MTRKILDSTLESASFSIVFQIFLRCITFFLTAFVLRYITSDVVGVMNVRLLLLESTVLFLSREAFRRAALSQSESHSWPQIINLVWLTIPLSVVISLLFGFLWLNVLDVPSPDITPHYSIGVWSISISCVIEMLAEPLFIASQAFLFTKLKQQNQGPVEFSGRYTHDTEAPKIHVFLSLAHPDISWWDVSLDFLVVFVRTVIFAVWIVINSKQSVVAFSAAQIVANSLYSIGFYVYFYLYMKNNNQNDKDSFFNLISQTKRSNSKIMLKNEEKEKIRNERTEEEPPSLKRRQSSLVGFDEPFPFTSLMDFLPKSIDGQSCIHSDSAWLTWSFFKQGILKQILAEGERYIMTLFSVMSFKEQGMYDVVNNLGSLIVRFLFRPVEDSLYFYFTQSIKRDTSIKDQNQERMKEVSTVLSQSLNCIVGIGLVIFVFGQSYSTLLLYLYGGNMAASGQGPALLQAHSFSVLLLGINGITECYAFSAMTAEQLNKHNYLMAVFSVSLLVISWGVTKLFGGVGFIVANCCIMSARITHSIFFIKSRYSGTSFQPLSGLIPKKYFLATLLISLFITKLTERFCHSLTHFLAGTVCFIVVMVVWGFQERELVILAVKKWNNRKTKEE